METDSAWHPEIRKPLATIATKNAARGGTASDLLDSLDQSLLAQLGDTKEAKSGSVRMVTDEAHTRAVDYVAAQRAEYERIISGFESLAVQPGYRTATSDKRTLGAILQVADEAGLKFDTCTGVTISVSERQLQDVAGIGSRSTVRASKRRLTDLGWISILGSGQVGPGAPQAITVTSPWSPSLSAQAMHTDSSNHVQSSYVNEGMIGSEVVQGALAERRSQRGSVLWANKGLAETGRLIYESLWGSTEGLTAVDLRTLASRNTVGKRLRQMAEVGLVEQRGKRWFATDKTIDDVADDLALHEWHAQIRERNRREREQYHDAFPAVGNASPPRGPPEPLAEIETASVPDVDSNGLEGNA